MTTVLEPAGRTLDIDGLRLHYLDWGNPGAPPIVCVHGYTSSAQAFNALARRLRDRHHVVAPDVRGHGESGWSPAGAYRYEDQVGDLAALVDKLGLARFTLVGTSMGGIIAMAYAGAYPDRLERLVINDIGPDVEVGSQRITQMVGSRPDEFATLDDAMAYRRQMSPIVAGRSPEDQRELALGVLRQRPDGRWIWKMDPEYIRQRVRIGAPATARALAGAPACDVPDPGRVGKRQRRAVPVAGAAHGRRTAEGRAGHGARCRARAHARGAGGGRGARAVPALGRSPTPGVVRVAGRHGAGDPPAEARP